MVPNRISASIDDQAIKEIQEAVEKIREKLPFLLHGYASERPYLLNIGENLIPFIEQSLNDANTHEHLMPPFLDLEELQRDLDLFNQLLKILKPMTELAELLSDTTMAAGSDAFETAVTFYKSVRMSARLGDPHAEAILDELRVKLPSWKRRGGAIGVDRPFIFSAEA